MKTLFTSTFCCAVMLMPTFTIAQNNFNYGVWQESSGGIDVSNFKIQGQIFNFKWKRLQPQQNVFDTVYFDSLLKLNSDTFKTPVIFQVEAKDECPNWLFDSVGVPKVIEYDDSLLQQPNGSFSPFYADTNYQKYFNYMTDAVANHIKQLPFLQRKMFVAIIGSYGNPGDYLSYRGYVQPKYNISNDSFFVLWKMFTLHTYNKYDSDALLNQIKLISNPSNNNQEHTHWVDSACPHGWLKMPTLGKEYQINDEVDKALWLLDILNTKHSNKIVRGFSELSNDDVTNGWWKEDSARNMFALMCYMIHWGMDINGQTPPNLQSTVYNSAFNFYNKYAGQKDTATATNAMCMLRDGLDAANTTRFPIAIYGSANRNNITRYKKIDTLFLNRGARLEDPNAASSSNELGNLAATGINDVGWRIFGGCYERYLHLMNTGTSVGYWNVNAASDAGSMYGRFARGFDMPTNKKALYFNIDNTFLNANGTPLNGAYSISITFTYLDKGHGSFSLYYDAQGDTNKLAKSNTCNNSLKWKIDSVTLSNAYFGNRSVNGSDFYISSNNRISTDTDKNVIFNIVELRKIQSGGKQNFAKASVPKSTAPDLRIAPNPSHNLIHALFTFKESGKYILEITNLSGKILWQRQDIAHAGENEISIDVSKLISGTYIITLIDEQNDMKSVKFLKE